MSNKLSSPRIVCAANLYNDGTMIIGARHFDKIMHKTMNLINPDLNYWKKIGHPEQGFIDQHGTFHSRKDALKIATDNGQIFRDIGEFDELFSEHLY